MLLGIILVICLFVIWLIRKGPPPEDPKPEQDGSYEYGNEPYGPNDGWW